jgi:hypothetical protein
MFLTSPDTDSGGPQLSTCMTRAPGSASTSAPRYGRSTATAIERVKLGISQMLFAAPEDYSLDE